MNALLVVMLLSLVVIIGAAAAVYLVEGRRQTPDLERAMWTIVVIAAPVLGFIVWLLLRGLPRPEDRTRISPR